MSRLCCDCKDEDLTVNVSPCLNCYGTEKKRNWVPKKVIKNTEGITFPVLNNLTPTLTSCTAKVYEEIGELMQCLGKGKRMSGEQIPEKDHAEWVYDTIAEVLDGIQSLITLLDLLAKENNVDIEWELGRHTDKMVRKGYLI
jgi:hypothetical protein